MPKLDEQAIEAFQDELQKIAAGLAPAATLGVLGAGLGGFSGYSRARQEGKSVGGALGAAGKGALTGGALGALGGAGLSKVAPGVAGAIGRFGQRQVHGVTGWSPKGGLAEMRMSPGDAASSLPEFAKHVKDKGVLGAIGAGARHQLNGASLPEKALVLGLPAAGLAGELRKSQVADLDHSKEENVGRRIGELVGGLAGGPIPLVGSAMLGEAAGRVGQLAGKGVHKVRSLLNPANGIHPGGPHPNISTDLTAEAGQTAPSEKLISDRASGANRGME